MENDCIFNRNRTYFRNFIFNQLMKSQGKTPKQYRDSMFIFELAFWALIIVLILMKFTA